MADTKLYKVAITPCGKYVHGKEYDRLCLVLNATEDGGDGCSYVSLQKNKNVRPGTDDTVWALSLERGEQGEQGPSGAGFSQVSISVDGTSGTPSGTAVIANDTLYLSFSGMKGAPGEIDEEQLQGIEGQIAAKQDALVSGTNIKTIGNQSILGSGNIQVGDENAVKFVSQSLTSEQKTQARTNIGAQDSLVSGTNIKTINQTSLLGSGDIVIPKGDKGDTGDTGATPDFSIGTVTTAEPGTPAAATMTGTPEDPVLNLTIPKGEKGDQGNTGSSVDYPYELVNNETTDDATKGHTAAGGKRLNDKISQLEAEVDENTEKLAVVVQGSSYTSPNLFDKTAATSGKGVRKDTGALYNGSFYASDYIAVPAGAASVYMTQQTYSGVIGWACYNASKQYTHGDNGRKITFQEGDAYFRFSVNDTNIDTAMIVVGASAADLPAQYVPYGSLSTYALKDEVVTTPKIEDSAVTTPKIADGAVTSSKLASGVLSTIEGEINTLDGRADATDAFLAPESVITKSSNLLDLSACQHGYIDNRDGSFHAISSEGTYAHYFATDFIPASENGLYCSCYAVYGTVGKGAVYDSSKAYLRALNSGTYEYVSGDGFVRWTMVDTYTYLQVNEGDELGPIEPYYDPIVRDYIGNENFRIKALQVQGAVAPSRTPFGCLSASGTIATGESVVAPRTNITKGIFISAEILGTISSVEVGVARTGRLGRWVEITPTSLIVKYGESSTVAATYTHGLTLGERTRLYIERVDRSAVRLRLVNDAGEVFTQDNVTWLTQLGNTFVYNGNSSGTIDASISVMPRDIDRKIWVFGDSYANITDPSRWPYYLVGWGFSKWLLNAYPGINAQDTLPTLKRILETGARPAFIVWGLGMNGGEDSSGNVNADWKAVTDELIDICEEYGITPVFQTIPTVPDYTHDALNAWIRNSGYRYIDIAAAVEAEGTTTWLGWGTDDALLSSDEVHPTQKGAVVIASKFLADFPELAIE